MEASNYNPSFICGLPWNISYGYGPNSPRQIFNKEGKALMFVPADPELREQIKQRYPSIDWKTMTYGIE